MTDDRSEQLDFDEVLDRSGEQIRLTLEGLVGQASPSTVFSDPQVVGDHLVFTAAAWERGGGFGFGAGLGDDGVGGRGAGGGGGGGAGSQGRPVAVISVGPDGVVVRPVIDFTRIGLTVLLSALGVWRVLRKSQ
ncbi:MAG TPA: hypothetical protein VFL72_02555 [Acidimicrobiia bacterium]|nr:hypothetical protein [Acidimicrobiia bacterium]